MVNPVVVVNYDPDWPQRFQFFRGRITAALGRLAGIVEHVGSTAVVGLAAKPIIDMDVLLASADALTEAIERLANLGYTHQGDLGIPEREAFLGPTNDLPHHLYVCPPHSREFKRHLAFRDYLRANSQEAKAYGDLKQALALKFVHDRAAYMAGKDEFIREILSRAISEECRPLGASDESRV
jgi:GrpB-like predicted nucleotidyltransferase (UPF0157 family)